MKRHPPEEREYAGPLFDSIPAATVPHVSRESVGSKMRVEARAILSSATAAAEPIHGAATSTVDAIERRDEGMANTLTSAEARASAWCDQFVEGVRLYARTHRVFMAEDILAILPPPSSVNPKVTGPLMKRAQALGYVVADGFAPANTSNRSPKCRWRSLVFLGEAVSVK